MSQLCTSTERYECLRLGLELRWRFFLSFSLSDTPHYENVPFEVPELWMWCKLEDITLLIEDCPHSTAKDEGKGYPLVRTPNIGEGRLLLDGVHRVCKEVYDKRNVRAVPQVNDIIYAREAPAGNAAVIRENEHVCLGQRTVLIRPMDTFIDSVWLTYAMLAPYSRNHLTSKATGSTVTHVNMASIRPFDLPLPPLSEQHRIVAEIKKWFVLIEQIEHSKTNLQTIIKQTKSKILDLAIHGKLILQDPNDEPAIELLKRINPDFTPCDNGQYGKIPQGWFLVKLGDLFDAVSAKRVLKSEWRTKGVPFYRAREIVKLSEYNKVNNELFIEDKHYDELKKRYGVPASGDIMLSAVGTIGKSYIVKESDKFYYKDASVLCLRNHNKLSSMFFSMLFSSSFIEDQIKEYSKGTTVDTITLEKLKSYIVPLPPLNEQQRIVQKIEELFLVLDNIQKALEV